MPELDEYQKLVAHMLEAKVLREARWRELSRWICPWRGIFSGEETWKSDRSNGEMTRFTHAAAQACLRAASGMSSGMTPRNVSWFKPDFTETEFLEAAGARSWLDAVDRRMKDCLGVGGFYQAIQAFNLDLIWAGCALLYSETGETSPLRFECVQPGAFAVALDNEGRLESVARLLVMTPARLHAMFGDGVSRSVKAMLKDRPYEPRRVWHLTRPASSGRMPWESVWWEDGEKAFLRRGGFYEMPYFYTCWNEGRSVYGTGPGDDSLADARQIDLLERRKLEGLGKLVDPPVTCPNSLKGYVELSPGAINFSSDTALIRPILDLSPYAQAMRHIQEEIQIVSKRLEQSLMASIFASLPLDQRPAGMSATEFLERKRENLQQLGPVISAYEPNVLIPLLFRTAQTLDRAGLLPPPPQSLQGQPLLMKMEFISPMANALRQTGAETTRALFQDVANMLQASGNLEILDKIDLDQMVDELVTGLGAPGNVVRADADVAQIREQRAQSQAQQAQMQTRAQQAALAQAQADAAQSITQAQQAQAELEN